MFAIFIMESVKKMMKLKKLVIEVRLLFDAISNVFIKPFSCKCYVDNFGLWQNFNVILPKYQIIQSLIIH